MAKKRVHMKLANKCLTLFGVAVVLSVGVALWITWHRIHRLVESRPLEQAQTLAEGLRSVDAALPRPEPAPVPRTVQVGPATLIWAVYPLARTTPTPAAAGKDSASPASSAPAAPIAPAADPLLQEVRERVADGDTKPVWAWRAIPENLRARLNDPSLDNDHPLGNATDHELAYAVPVLTPPQTAPSEPVAELPAEPGDGILLIHVIDPTVARQIIVNRIYIISAGFTAGLIGLTVFGWATARLILGPLKTLELYARKASAGDLNVRADVNTGDEFEQLCRMFNRMLVNLKGKHDELTAANKSLDLKLGQLAQSNQALDQANQVKNEFLANVSHELRTPLNSIIGFGEILKETLPPAVDGDKVSAKRHRYTDNIIHSSQQLLDLITDMLDLAKIEAGRMSLNVAAVSVSDTCEGLINLMKPAAGKNGVVLRLKVEGGLPVIQTDPGKLQQILFNFLSNAIKFTPAGGEVTLSAGLVPSIYEDQPHEVRFAVRDTGPGIAVEDQEKVFEKFNQLDPAVTREHGGTGLGLAISRELAQMLQGRVDLESAPGHGAVFSVAIPATLRSRENVLMPELA